MLEQKSPTSRPRPKSIPFEEEMVKWDGDDERLVGRMVVPSLKEESLLLD